MARRSGMTRRSRRRVTGVIPRLFKALGSALGWAFRHPQPLIVAIVLAGLFVAVWRQVQRLDAFRVERIEMPEDSLLKMPDSVMGANLWELDLQTLATTLKRQQPWLKGVRVIRVLPSTLRVDVIERFPAAQVQLDQWYPVDAEGYILPQGSRKPIEEVSRLIGTETRQAPLRVGRVNTGPNLQLALRVLATLRRSPVLVARKVGVVDVSDPQQISFVIGEDTEIRCGSETELDEQMIRLKTALEQVSRQQISVRYIDVRFQEPVVSPRT